MKWRHDILSSLNTVLRRAGKVAVPDVQLRDFTPMDLKEGDLAVHLGRFLRGEPENVRMRIGEELQSNLVAGHEVWFSGDYLHVRVPIGTLLNALATELKSSLPAVDLAPPYALQMPQLPAGGAVHWRELALQQALNGMWQALFAREAVKVGAEAEAFGLSSVALDAALAMLERENLDLDGLAPSTFAEGVVRMQLLALPARGATPDCLAACFEGARPPEADFLLGLWRLRHLTGAERALPDWPAALDGEAFAGLGPEAAWRGLARAVLGLAAQLPSLAYPGKLPWLMHLLLHNHAALQPLWQAVPLEDPAQPASTGLRLHLLRSRQLFLSRVLAACGIHLLALPERETSASAS